jgi:hypothetical protein
MKSVVAYCRSACEPRRQGAEIGDISVIGKSIESVVANRWPEKDLHGSLRSANFVIGFRRMLDHVENRRVAFPGLSRPHTTAITLSSQMLRCLFPSLETLQPRILQRHHSSSPGLSSRVKPCGKCRTAPRLRGLTPAASPVFWLPCLRAPSLPLVSRFPLRTPGQRSLIAGLNPAPRWPLPC